MVNDLNRARDLLLAEGYTCVLVKGDSIHSSRERGVKPLVALLESARDVKHFHAADKVVGKATAFLYCLLGVKSVYAPVISTAALEVLRRHGIHTEFDLEADFIWNRRKTGPCPMESAVREISDHREAYAAILQTLAAMK